MKFNDPVMAGRVYRFIFVLWFAVGLCFWLVADNVLASVAFFVGAFLFPEKRAIKKAQDLL